MKSQRRRSRSHRSGLGRRENAGILAPGGRRKPSARRTRTESTGKGFFVVSGGRDRSSASWCGRKRPEPQSEASPTSLMTASGGGRMNRCLARNEGSKKNLRSKTGVTLAQAKDHGVDTIEGVRGRTCDASHRASWRPPWPGRSTRSSCSRKRVRRRELSQRDWTRWAVPFGDSERQSREVSSPKALPASQGAEGRSFDGGHTRRVERRAHTRALETVRRSWRRRIAPPRS